MCGDVLCGIRPESLVSPEQVAPFFVKLNSFFFMERRLLTAQSIDLRRASDPRIERVADRLGRSALIDQRQRDARVSGSLHPMTLSYACVW